MLCRITINNIIFLLRLLLLYLSSNKYIPPEEYSCSMEVLLVATSMVVASTSTLLLSLGEHAPPQPILSLISVQVKLKQYESCIPHKNCWILNTPFVSQDYCIAPPCGAFDLRISPCDVIIISRATALILYTVRSSFHGFPIKYHLPTFQRSFNSSRRHGDTLWGSTLCSVVSLSYSM